MQQRERSSTIVSHCILVVLKQQVVPVPQFVAYFLPAIIKYLENEDEGVAAMWSTTLIEAIPLLPIDVLQTHLTPVAYQASLPSQPVHKRIISCKIVGALSLKYDPPTVKKDLLPICLLLCQDEISEVRAAICLELEKVIAQLREDCFKTALGPSLIELGSDKVVKVKEAAFITAVNILNVVDAENVSTTILPLLIRMIEYGFANHDQNLLLTISSHFGNMCLGIKNAAKDKKSIVNYYSALTQAGLPHSQKNNLVILNADFQEFPLTTADLNIYCRQVAAANFPAVFEFCEGDTELIEDLLLLFQSLCSDPSVAIRGAVAAKMVQISRFAQNRNYFVQRNFINLLNDDAEEVLVAIVPQLSSLVSILVQYDVFSVLELNDELSSLNDFCFALLKCESLISTSRNWRLYCDFLFSLKSFVNVLPTNTLYADYICLFLKRMHQTRIVPVRSSLMETVLFFSHHLPNSEDRLKIIDSIIQDFCRSSNFYNRIFYLRSCSIIFEQYSAPFFKKYFLSPTLALANDPVPNIRLFLVKLIPKLEFVITHPYDSDFEKKLNSAKATLSHDKDKDVSSAMNSVSSISSKADMNCFINDKEKYEEEAKWGEYKNVEGLSPKSVTGSRIPRSPSSNSPLTFVTNKTVMRRKPPENQQQKVVGASILKENEAVDKSSHDGNEKLLVKKCIGFTDPEKSQSSPNSRQTSIKDKRLSLDEIDLNKSTVLVERRGIHSSPKPSQLPRPLSCINFSTKLNPTGKKTNLSKLPVSNRGSPGT